MITLTAPAPEPLSRSTPSERPAAAGRTGPAPLAARPRRARRRPARRHRPRRRTRRRGGVPARDHAAALPRRHPGRAEPHRAGRGPGRTAPPSSWPPRPRPPTASSCTPRCTRSPPTPTVWATTPRSWSPPTASWWAAPASCTSRSRPGYYEDTYFRPGPADDPYPVYAPGRSGRAHRHADLLGRMVPRGRPQLLARPAPRSSSTPPPSAPSRSSPTSTPARCGSRSSSPTASTAGCSWWCPTGSATRARSASTVRRSSPTRTAECWCRRPATRRLCWWPTSISTSAATGWNCSRSC